MTSLTDRELKSRFESEALVLFDRLYNAVHKRKLKLHHAVSKDGSVEFYFDRK